MTFQQGLQKSEKLYEEISRLQHSLIDVTKDVFLFSLPWWFSVFLLLIPWSVWILFHKKDQTSRLLFAGFAVMILSSILDQIGVDEGRWIYPVKAIPYGSMSFTFWYSFLPVSIMFSLQIKPSFSPFVKALGFAISGAFIGLPLLSLAHLYHRIDWSLWYSFFILFGLYLLAHWVSRRKSFEPFQD